MRHIIQAFILLGLLYYNTADAETTPDFGDPVSNGSAGDNQSFTEGTAAGIASGMYGNPDAIIEDEMNNISGREYKAQSAADDSETGSNVAAATGAALIATGVPMLMSLPTIPIGVTLITMGGIELAQAGADSGTQAENQDQEELLTMDENAQGKQQKSNSTKKAADAAAKRAAILDKLDTPELREFLTNQGVNSDAFIDDLAAGNLTDFDSVANAMNIPNNFSAEDRANAEQAAMAKFGNIQEERKDIGYDESQDSTFASSGGKQSEGEKLNPNDLAKRNGQVEVGAPAMANNTSTAASNTDGVDASGIFNSMFNKGKRGGHRNALSKMSAHRLRSMGLFKGTKNTNIFVKARRSYRSFGRWRNSTDSASRPTSNSGIRTAQVR